MDPLKYLNYDIFPHIFQHFSVKNILQASEVSPEWNSVLSESLDCMKKIWLRFYEPLDDVSALMKSKRKYRNVKIQRKINEKIIDLFHKFKWKKVMLRDMKILNFAEFEEMMKFLAPSVEELELWNIQFEKNSRNYSQLKLDFPLLKTLEFENSLETLEIFSHEINIENFIISSFPDTSESLKKLCLFLHHLKKLKHFSNKSHKLLVTNHMNLQLVSLKILINTDVKWKENLINFIKSQETLKMISIDCCDHEGSEGIFYEIWDALQVCENIELVNVPNIWNLMNLRAKTTVTILKVTGALKFINGLLNATPNLEILRVDRLTDDVLTFAAYSLKSLNVIEFMNESGQIENYKNMKQTEMEINRKIILVQLSVNDFYRNYL